MKANVWNSVRSRFVRRQPLGKPIVMAFSLLVLTVCLMPALAQEGEKKVKINQVPVKVKAAILKAIGESRLVDIGELTKDETKVYEIEMIVGNGEYDVLFSSDGGVLKKTYAGLKAEKGKVVDLTGESTQAGLMGKKWSFDDQKVGFIPAGWKVIQLGAKAKPARWEVVAETGAPSPSNVLSLTKTENTGDTWNLLTVEGIKITDLIVETKIKVISGKNNQGSGLAWCVVDPDNCYLARWTPLSRNFRVYCIKNGKAKRLTAINVRASRKAWCTIQVDHQGDKIMASMDGRKLIEIKDKTLTGPGAYGVYTKADATAEFDDFTVHAIRPSLLVSQRRLSAEKEKKDRNGRL